MVADTIYASVQKLPEPLQAEVLDFVQFLLLKAEHEATPEEDDTWMSMSLDLAMRGMEDEDTPEYTLSDIKEKFQ